MPRKKEPRQNIWAARHKTVLTFKRTGDFVSATGEVFKGAFWEANCLVCEGAFEQFHRVSDEGALRVHYGFLRTKCPACRASSRKVELFSDLV